MALSRGLQDGAIDLLHLGGGSDQVGVAVASFQLFAQRAVFRRQVAQGDQALEDSPEIVNLKGLGDVIVRADLQPDDFIIVIDARGQHDDRSRVQTRIGARRAGDGQPIPVGQH